MIYCKKPSAELLRTAPAKKRHRNAAEWGIETPLPANEPDPKTFVKISPAVAPNWVSVPNAPRYLAHLLSAQPIIAAEVALISDGNAYRIDVNEDMLHGVGCTYHSLDPAQIRRLLGILKSSAKLVPSYRLKIGESRNGVFLTLADGSKIKLMFSQNFQNDDHIDGILYNSADQSSLKIALRKNLQPELYQWAMHYALSQLNPHVMNEECLSSDFID